MEFVEFRKIRRFDEVGMQITQKLHGTSAQINIEKLDSSLDGHPDSLTVDGEEYFIRAGSRNRWIYPGDDNFGFAKFVDENKEEIIRKLGPGRHFGEWAGPGINSGEGLKEKTFVLFDFWNYDVESLPAKMVIVPVLYQGKVDLEAVNSCFEDLQKNGSKLSPGFMNVEGIVVSLGGTRYKKVFKPEETKWSGTPKNKTLKDKDSKESVKFDLDHLLQPMRLEKLLSRDERYVVGYPDTLSAIVSDYVKDLIEEGQIVGDESQIKAIKKQLSGPLFGFIKSKMNNGFKIY